MKTTRFVKLALIILFIVSNNNTYAQNCPQGDIIFETQSEVDSFLIIYPDCKEINRNLNIGENISNLNGLLGITKIHGGFILTKNSLLKNFSGLDSLIYIGKLKGEIEVIRGYDWAWDFETNELYELAIIEERKDISLYILNNSGLKDFSGLEKLRGLGGMIWLDNNDNLINIDGLSSLTSIGSGEWGFFKGDPFLQYEFKEATNISAYIRYNDSLFSISGLDQVKEMEGSFRLSSNKNLQQSEILKSIEKVGLQSILYWIDEGGINEEFEQRSVYIKYNSKLSSCASAGLCRIIQNNAHVHIGGNGNECIKDFILDFCTYFGNVVHPVFYDLNENGAYDTDEVFVNGANILIEPDGIISPSNQINGGTVFLSPNSYTLTLDTSNLTDWYVTSDSISIQVDIDSLQIRDTIYFGIHPLDEVTDITAITIPSNYRCNEYAKVKLIADNAGTTTASGTIWIQVDPSISEVKYIDLPDTIQGDSLIGWYFEDLFPRNTIEKHIELKMPGPPDIIIGDPVHFNSKIVYSDVNGTDSTLYYNSIILECAYDPNDKLVGPVYPENYALIDQELNYTIRFQNTGNAYAKNVIIQDSLDLNLDTESFKFINSSHPDVLSISINDNAIVTFDFHEIYLPDSTESFEESQGFVSFSIRAKDTINNLTQINNYADIYFDYNPPITTNTTVNIMVHSLDADQDGVFIWNDCDDHDPIVGVQADEEILYDGLDNDCDANTLDDDLDQDGFNHDEDCDDENASINPDAEEIPNNGIDENCDGEDLIVSTEEYADFKINIFPNPTHDQLTIIHSGELYTDSEARIYDITGKKLFGWVLEDSKSVKDLSNMEPGIYYIEISNKRLGVSYVEKIIKLHRN